MHHFRLLLVLLVTLPLASAAQDGAKAYILNIQGPIGPAVADYVHTGLAKAQTASAELAVLRVDTPGGLDSAMRDIIRDILSSTVPVVVYVAPGGARAASAGTYILYAAHVAAMAPATNLGAATPVQIGGLPMPSPSGPESPAAGKEKQKEMEKPKSSMEKKVVNDAVAYIRSLAQMRGRNAEWAETAVRQAASLSSEDALKLGVIDLIAVNLPDLLKRLDGRIVAMDSQQRTLHTAKLALVEIEPDWRNRLLAVITNPNIAYILMLLGVWGLFFEFAHPGFIVPGVVGAICLLLALFAFQALPVNYAGLALIALGIAFMVAEAFAPSFGVLGIGGLIAFVIGSVMLLDTGIPGYGIALPLIIAVALVSGAFFFAVVTLAAKAWRRPVVSGQEELVGATATVVHGFRRRGRVHVHGENWQARTSRPVKTGDAVHITGLDGLILIVEPVEKEE